MGQFYSKVAGVTAKNSDGKERQNYIYAFCKPRMKLILLREPENPYDPDAVAVWIKARALLFFTSEVQIGYLNSDISSEISQYIENGGRVEAEIKEVTGGTESKQSYGVNILINKH